MSIPNDWLSALLLGMFCLMLFLRLNFPNASNRSKTLVMVAVTVLFFSICGRLANSQERFESERGLTHATSEISLSR
jgi:hypothetical protein